MNHTTFLLLALSVFISKTGSNNTVPVSHILPEADEKHAALNRTHCYSFGVASVDGGILRSLVPEARVKLGFQG